MGMESIPHNFLTGRLEDLVKWARRNSVWPATFGLACCAIEMMATGAAHYDLARYGMEVFRASPRQADLMIVAGTCVDKMIPSIIRVWEQMPEPKYAISFGSCSNSGGPYWDSYCVTKGVDQVIPVDVYVPGCPPRPEGLLHGIIRLQEKIADERLSGTAITHRALRPSVTAAEVNRPLLRADAGGALKPRAARGPSHPSARASAAGESP